MGVYYPLLDFFNIFVDRLVTGGPAFFVEYIVDGISYGNGAQELSMSVRKLVFLEARGVSRVQLAFDVLLPMEHVISGIIKPRL